MMATENRWGEAHLVFVTLLMVQLLSGLLKDKAPENMSAHTRQGLVEFGRGWRKGLQSARRTHCQCA